MAFEFHTQRTQYFSYQRQNALEYVLPFIEAGGVALAAGSRVLEVGCGEGGVLLAFVERGCAGVGVELVEDRYKQACRFLEQEVAAQKVRLYCRNIYDADFEEEFSGFFDLIVLKDVIEHIPDQLRLLGVLKRLLKPSGYIYFGFPPWYMPFGGHQQICINKRLSKLPYMHLLPSGLYRRLLEWGGEKPHTVQELLELQETGISIERFERIAAQGGFDVVRRSLYLINPIYKYKFGLEARLQYGVLGGIPFLRNFVTTCAYYLVKSR